MANELFEAFKKFFSPKEEVLKHWYSSVDNFQFASTDFYQRIEQELEARKVPGLNMSRIELSEGGLLSDKREYLRLKRERLVFDICAAPFGTSYFFSFRTVELPLGIKPTEMVVFLGGIVGVFAFLIYLLGALYGIIVWFVLMGAAIWVMRNSLTLGLKDLDTSLMKTRVLGPVYELFFRKETYHREDTRLMYVTTVNSITEKLVEEVTLAKGVKLLKRYDRKPIHGELYQERPGPLPAKGDEPAVAKA